MGVLQGEQDGNAPGNSSQVGIGHLLKSQVPSSARARPAVTVGRRPERRGQREAEAVGDETVESGGNISEEAVSSCG